MSASQPDLFASAQSPREAPSDEILAIVRKRLRATLTLVQEAETMPWTNMLDIIKEDNAFRFGKEILPAAEGAALWAAFDVEMDRLYAIMNEGEEIDRDV